MNREHKFDLWHAYEQTQFYVRECAPELCIRIGSHHEQLDEMLLENNCDTWSYITASNPASELLSGAQNAGRNRELVELLRSQDLVFYRGEGIGSDPTWPAEASFLILGISREAAMQLGRQFGQNAIVCGKRDGPAELVDCR